MYLYWPLAPIYTGYWHIFIMAIGTYFYWLLMQISTEKWDLILLPIGTYFYWLMAHTCNDYWHILILAIYTYFYWQLAHKLNVLWHILQLAICTYIHLAQTSFNCNVWKGVTPLVQTSYMGKKTVKVFFFSFITRLCVAGAVLQTHLSLIDWFIHSLSDPFPQNL